MKKLVMGIACVILFVSNAFAHDGTIGLFTSDLAVDCDGTPTAYVPYTVYMVYLMSDGGPNGILGWDLRVEFSVGAPDILVGVPIWAPNTLPQGTDIEYGVSVVSDGGYCIGLNDETVYLGHFTVMSTGIVGFRAQVMPHTDNNDEVVYVVMCDIAHTEHVVTGGTFIFQDGQCNTDVEDSSWGAIKSLFKE